MPPNSEVGEVPDQFGKRLDEHGAQLSQHSERLNIHAARFDKVDLVLSGDTKLGITGLVQSMAEVNKTLHDLLEWRKEVVFYAKMIILGGRMVLVLLALIVGGVWWPEIWPQVQVIIKLIGG